MDALTVNWNALREAYEPLRVPILIGTLLVIVVSLFKDDKSKIFTSNGLTLGGNEKKDRIVKPVIKPVPDSFDWKTADPLKSYPFKEGLYKLTMGIKNLDPQDYLLVEPVHAERLQLKQKLMSNSHPAYPQGKDIRKETVFYKPEAEMAVKEYYDFVLDYMCTKYPKLYVKIGNNQVLNKTIDEVIPAHTDDKTPGEDYVVHLSKVIDEDYIILQKDPSRSGEKDGDEYFFKAGIFTFAAGFAPSERFDTPLSYIHHPIPGYEDKLKPTMNRFFDKLLPFRFVTRSNFSVQTHNKFYVDDSNKGHNLSADYEQKPLDYDSLDFEKDVHYRSERQVLTKLPKSGAVVFTIRTYLIPMAQIKKEPKEVRERFIGAINGLQGDISAYKRSKEWGPPVIKYLSDD